MEKTLLHVVVFAHEILPSFIKYRRCFLYTKSYHLFLGQTEIGLFLSDEKELCNFQTSHCFSKYKTNSVDVVGKISI
jgi:hypothetical protein